MGGVLDVAGTGVAADSNGVPGVHQNSDTNDKGRGGLGRISVSSGLVLLSDELQNILKERGVAVEAKDASADKAAFSAALTSARENDSPPRVYNARGLCTSSAIGQTMRFVRRPMPSISISTTSPFFSHGSFFPFSSATPLGVPVKIRSPGSSAIYREA